MKLPMLLGACVLASTAYALAQDAVHTWPIVNPFANRYRFVDNQTNSYAMVIIFNSDGCAAYKLECYLNAYDFDGPEFNYSGAFECRLLPVYEQTLLPTLLANCQKPTRDWESYGRFLVNELTNTSASAKNDGYVRQVRLRNMKITLGISNVVFESNNKDVFAPVTRIASLDFNLTVACDPAAFMESAEGVGPSRDLSSKKYQPPPPTNPPADGKR